jgi:predicted protein tyrosine phosphatase
LCAGKIGVAVLLPRPFFPGTEGIEVRSAGTAADADCTVSTDLLDWADEIVVMEKRHIEQLRRKFSEALQGKRLINLNIHDRYTLMQPELIDELRAKASRWM